MKSHAIETHAKLVPILLLVGALLACDASQKKASGPDQVPKPTGAETECPEAPTCSGRSFGDHPLFHIAMFITVKPGVIDEYLEFYKKHQKEALELFPTQLREATFVSGGNPNVVVHTHTFTSKEAWHEYVKSDFVQNDLKVFKQWTVKNVYHAGPDVFSF